MSARKQKPMAVPGRSLPHAIGMDGLNLRRSRSIARDPKAASAVSEGGRFSGATRFGELLGQFYAQNGRGKVAQGLVQPHDKQRGVIVLVHLRHALDWIFRLHQPAHGT